MLAASHTNNYSASPDDARVKGILTSYHRRGITDRRVISKLLLEEVPSIVMRYVLRRYLFWYYTNPKRQRSYCCPSPQEIYAVCKRLDDPIATRNRKEAARIGCNGERSNGQTGAPFHQGGHHRSRYSLDQVRSAWFFTVISFVLI